MSYVPGATVVTDTRLLSVGTTVSVAAGKSTVSVWCVSSVVSVTLRAGVWRARSPTTMKRGRNFTWNVFSAV